jgi:predicted small secreted protein
MKHLFVLAITLLLSACATTVGIGQTKLAQVTHQDLEAAALYANNHGYPARAAVYIAIETQLTACEKAITAAEPVVGPAPRVPGIITAYEIAAEAAGSIQTIPAAVKLNCAALPLVTFPTLKLP